MTNGQCSTINFQQPDLCLWWHFIDRSLYISSPILLAAWWIRIDLTRTMAIILNVQLMAYSIIYRGNSGSWFEDDPLQKGNKLWLQKVVKLKCVFLSIGIIFYLFLVTHPARHNGHSKCRGVCAFRRRINLSLWIVSINISFTSHWTMLEDEKSTSIRQVINLNMRAYKAIMTSPAVHILLLLMEEPIGRNGDSYIGSQLV